AEVRSKTAIECKAKVVQYRISTMPNNRWEIVEPNGRLRGSYLVAPAMDVVAEQPFFRVDANSRTVKITLTLEVRPSDIYLEFERLGSKFRSSFSNKKKPNQAKIAKILVIKHLERVGDERISLAQTTLRATRIGEAIK